MGFAVTVDGRDVWSQFAPRSGVRYGSPIPEYIEAAHWDNLSYNEFQEKPAEYQEIVIAAYRTANQINAVLAHKRQRKQKSGNAPVNSGRGRRNR